MLGKCKDKLIGIHFPAAEQADQWKYINRSQTHECGNWD
jgi:hypothetical protein